MVEIVTKDTDWRQTVSMLNGLEKYGRDVMVRSGQAERLRDGINAYNGKGRITKKGAMNVRLNQFRSDVEVVAARDIKLLVGNEPYLPLASENKLYEWEAKQIETVMNTMLKRNDPSRGYYGFYWEQAKNLTVSRALGRSYLELAWEASSHTFTQRQPIIDPVLQIPTGYEEIEVTRIADRLMARQLGPYQVICHPAGRTTWQAPWVIAKELLSVDAILEMHENPEHPFKLPDEVDRKKLLGGPSGIGEEWMDQWRRDQGILGDQETPEMAVFLRIFMNPTREHKRGRWAYWVNYEWLGFDGESQFENCPPNVKPIINYDDSTGVGPGDDFGTGMYEQTRDLEDIVSDSLSIFMDGVTRDTEGRIVYDSMAMNAEDLARGYRQPYIPLKKGFSATLDNAFREIPRQPANEQLLKLADKMIEIKRTRNRLEPYQTGETPTRKETLGVSQMLASAGDAVLENRTRNTEMGPFAATAYLASKLVAANIDDDDVATIIGPEAQARLTALDPEAIPGLYWGFKGSTTVIRESQETDAKVAHWNMVANDPGLDPNARYIPLRELAKRVGGYTDDEAEKMHPAPTEQPAEVAAMNAQPAMPEVQSVGEAGAILPPNQLPQPGGGMP